MLEIAEQKIVATTQKLEFNSLMMIKTTEGFVAKVTFFVKNEKNKIVETIQKTYKKSEYNAWWTDFNSGKFLYEEIVKDYYPNKTVPDTIEQEFVNK